MGQDGLWQRFRRSRVGGVLLVYAGAAWVVLQLIDVLDGIVPLPDWLGPGALVLLAIGLVVVLATAFVQGGAGARTRDVEAEAPGAWELDLDRIDDEIRARGLPHLTWARAVLGGVVAFSLLLGAAGLVTFLRYRGAVTEPVSPLVAGEPPEPALVVLPFDVRAADLELAVWEEGLVVSLAANLDGVEGLRTIDYGTVLARWSERVPEGATPDLATALATARAAGGEWAVIGSLLETGDDVRIDASVRSVASGETLEQIRVEGSADSVVGLIDRLSVEVLRAVLPERGLEGSIGLGSVASASPAAVKAWVEGERDYRLGRFEEAQAAFERAVAADSMFALAWFRLAQSRGWRLSTPDAVSASDAWGHVVSLADRLSPRERLIVRAQRSLHGADSIPVDSLRAYAVRHPEDAEAWYVLGERLYHLGSPDAWERADPAFERAIALQPRFVPYHIHAIDLAFQLDPDSALARQRVARLERVAPESPEARMGRLSFDLAFGDEAIRQAALAELPQLPLGQHQYLLGRLSHPGHRPVRGQVAAALASRQDLPPGFLDEFQAGGIPVLTMAGQLGQALQLAGLVANPGLRYCRIAAATQMVGVVPASLRAGALGPEPRRAALDALRNPTAAAGWARGAACAGGLARVAGFEDEAIAWTVVLDSALAVLPPGERTTAQETVASTVALVEAALALQAGNPSDALERARESALYSAQQSDMSFFRARLLLAADRPAEALAEIEPYGATVLGSLLRARALEALGEDPSAREAYTYFLDNWQPDLPELAALADSARAGLTRIQGRLN